RQKYGVGFLDFFENKSFKLKNRPKIIV
ncbi:MAG: hypothetical protein RL329_2110, partial [Bacteroidota bacterium]